MPDGMLWQVTVEAVVTASGYYSSHLKVEDIEGSYQQVRDIGDLIQISGHDMMGSSQLISGV